jgi:hypothetical protein
MEKVNAIQAAHDANPGAKEGKVRTAQIDSLTVRIETQSALRRKAAQALSDNIAPEDVERVCADEGFKRAMNEGNPFAVLAAAKMIQKGISPTDTNGDNAQGLSANSEEQAAQQGKDTFQFFEHFEASVRDTPGLLLGTIPGDLTDGQRARIAQHDANLVLFLTLMNLTSSTHELRLAMELTMDQARLASLSAAEYKGLLLGYLASHAPAPLSGFAALGHVKDKRSPAPRLPNGEYDFAKIQCFKCQLYGHFGYKCPRPTSSSAKTTSSEEATLQILQEMKAEMQSLRASMRDEAMAAAAAHYALGIPLSALGPLRSAEDSDEE